MFRMPTPEEAVSLKGTHTVTGKRFPEVCVTMMDKFRKAVYEALTEVAGNATDIHCPGTFVPAQLQSQWIHFSVLRMATLSIAEWILECKVNDGPGGREGLDGITHEEMTEATVMFQSLLTETYGEMTKEFDVLEERAELLRKRRNQSEEKHAEVTKKVLENIAREEVERLYREACDEADEKPLDTESDTE